MCTTLQELQDLQKQITKLTTTMNQLHSERFGCSPSHTIPNPQEGSTKVITNPKVVAMQPSVITTTVPGFADSIYVVADSILVVADSIAMAEIDNYVPTIFDLVDVVKIANFVANFTDIIDMTLGADSWVEIADLVDADTDITEPMCVDANIADPGYVVVDLDERAEDADSVVDKLDNVNMIESADFVVEGLDLADKIAILDLADSRNQDKVTIYSNIQEEARAKSNNLEGGGSESNNQEATEPNSKSRNCKQAENEPVPNCRDPTRAKSDLSNKTDTESALDK
ncbi:hypothetical protein CR513_07949, partial [Mucuna pruriens]